MYSPIVFGYHPDMLREKQKAYKRYLDAVKND
jgi:hypothetical protein